MFETDTFKRQWTPHRNPMGEWSNPTDRPTHFIKRAAKITTAPPMSLYQSDPICSSAGCVQYMSPTAEEMGEYVAPSYNFDPTLDHEIKTSEQNLRNSEEKLGEKFE